MSFMPFVALIRNHSKITAGDGFVKFCSNNITNNNITLVFYTVSRRVCREASNILCKVIHVLRQPF